MDQGRHCSRINIHQSGSSLQVSAETLFFPDVCLCLSKNCNYCVNTAREPAT